MLATLEVVKSSGRRAPLVLACLASVILASACGGGTERPASERAAQPAPAPPAPPSRPRVFFVQPGDGATVKSPVNLQFGVESFTIAPVPQGTVTSARPGLGHHHVGVDTDCLPPGTEIPKAAPWVHFGDGKSVIDMQLPPGPHKLTLQIGDDQHRTIEGLCSTISVTVAG